MLHIMGFFREDNRFIKSFSNGEIVIVDRGNEYEIQVIHNGGRLKSKVVTEDNLIEEITKIIGTLFSNSIVLNNYLNLVLLAKSLGYKYSSNSREKINSLKESHIRKIRTAFNEGNYTDIRIRLNGKVEVIEITPMNDIKEIDTVFMSIEEYNKKYKE